ncbi:ABC-three component system middle component 6 [Aneurinibacillus sp. Ricciae_BoGa-3]|uniref:ABC-three component system middle component 6 n=1 Tax=Aneurinibacillus sp. Ricciae_BoGa-3 TaxID=3022697 RepID=UPI003FA4CECE
MDISKSLLSNTAKLISILTEQEYFQFNELYIKYKIRNKNANYKNFILSIDMLFCFGKISYNKNNDLIGLCQNETEQTV